MWRQHRSQFYRVGGGTRLKRLLYMNGNNINLPDPPYALPTSSRFETERSGTFDKKWLLEQLPACKPLVRESVYMPNKEELWELPMHEGLEKIAERLPYHDVLRYIMEHNYFFLFTTLLKAPDAPLPHVLYDDFMKCRTFASLQNPPEEQFALPPGLLRTLLCMAAFQCILDPHYFTTCQLLFRRLEQQQVITSEVLSAWVYCCTASGKVDEALAYAKHMADHDVPFDETVFSLMQHPSVNPVAAEHRAVWHSAKGILLQRRLSGRLQGVYCSDSVATHGMFVFYALTLSHVKKWEVIRAAASLGIPLPERTLSLVVDVYAREKGLRCGEKTIKALALFLASEGTAAQLLFVLLRAKKNELLLECEGLPQLVFNEAEKENILQLVKRRTRRENDFRLAIPFLRALVQEDDPRHFFDSLTHAVHVNSDRGIVPAAATTTTVDKDKDFDFDRTQKNVSSDENSLQSVVVSVQGLLREVDAIEKTSRNVLSRRGSLYSSPPTIGDKRVVREELKNLQNCDMSASLRELARLHLVEEAEESNRTLRLHAAWVNPDGTL